MHRLVAVQLLIRMLVLLLLVLLQVIVAERAAVEPPRLGKHRFEAAPVAVLTSDEVTGSLRQIKVRDIGGGGC